MKVLILKHVEIEGPGLIEICLRKRKIPYEILTLNPNIFMPKLDDFTHIVLLGGPMNVYEEDRYPFLKNEDLFIKEAIQRGKSILGICLGAQLIAKALGAKVFKAPIKEIGWYEVSLTELGSKDPLFSNFPKTFSVFQWHGDTFDIPKGAKLLATSTSIPHQAFRYGKNVYGLQFHLEVTEEIIHEWIEVYNEAFDRSENLHSSKEQILIETQKNIKTYTRRGLKFLKKFLRSSYEPLTL